MNIDIQRGFFGIGIYEPKFTENLGTLWRHAYLYNASFIFTIGSRFKKQASNTNKADRHIPLYFYNDYEHFKENKPINSAVIAIEMAPNSICLSRFSHPQRALYLLGSEGIGIPEEIYQECDSIVQLYSPKSQSMNVSTTGTIVMYDRIIKNRSIR